MQTDYQENMMDLYSIRKKIKFVGNVSMDLSCIDVSSIKIQK